MNKDSVQGLKIKPGRGPKRRIKSDSEDIARDILTNNPRTTIDQLQQILLNQHGVKVGRTTVYRLIKRLRFSYITSRP